LRPHRFVRRKQDDRQLRRRFVRAIEEPSQAVNAGNLRCEYDANGVCTSVKPCYGDFQTNYDDDCLGPVEERAWSSPIFVNYKAG